MGMGSFRHAGTNPERRYSLVGIDRGQGMQPYDGPLAAPGVPTIEARVHGESTGIELGDSYSLTLSLDPTGWDFRAAGALPGRWKLLLTDSTTGEATELTADIDAGGTISFSLHETMPQRVFPKPRCYYCPGPPHGGGCPNR